MIRLEEGIYNIPTIQLTMSYTPQPSGVFKLKTPFAAQTNICWTRTNSCTVYCNGHRLFMALAVCIFCRMPQPCVFLHNYLVCRWPCVIVMVMVMCFFCIVCCLYFLQNCKNENQLLLAMTLCFVSA